MVEYESKYYACACVPSGNTQQVKGTPTRMAKRCCIVLAVTMGLLTRVVLPSLDRCEDRRRINIVLNSSSDGGNCSNTVSPGCCYKT